MYLDLYVLEDDSWISKGSFMQTKHLCVLIHIRIKGEIGTVKLVKPSSDFLTDRSKAVFFVDHFYFGLVFAIFFLCHAAL